MTQVQTGLAIVVAVIAVLAFAAAALAYVKTSIDKATIVTLEKNGAALTARVTLLEREKREQVLRIEALERENKILASQRPSAEAIAALASQLTEHDERTMELLEARS